MRQDTEHAGVGEESEMQLTRSRLNVAPKRAGCLVDEAWALIRDTWSGFGVDQISNIPAGAEDSNSCETRWIGKEEQIGQLRFSGAGEIRQLSRAALFKAGLTQLRHRFLGLNGVHGMKVASRSQFV